MLESGPQSITTGGSLKCHRAHREILQKKRLWSRNMALVVERSLRLFLLLCPFFLVQAAFGGQPVRVGVYQNSPKIFVDEAGHPAGFFIDLLEEIARQEQWQLEYRHCHWEGCLDLLEKGRIDLLPDVAYSKARGRRFGFGREVALSSWSVFYTPGDEELFSLKALDGRKVAVVQESIQYEALKKRARELGIEPDYLEVPGMQDVFRLVQSRKVAAGLVNTYFGWRNAAEYGLRESRVLIRPTLLYIAASPSATAPLLPIVDDYLTAWKQDRDSIYHQAMARWLVPAEASQVQRWLYWVALMALLLLGLVVFLVLLVRQLVKSKTAELEQKTDRLDHLAHHDPLTGLPNRLLFFDRLKHSIRQSRRQGTNLALLFLDLDQFKQINDTYGHGVGDELLKEVAKRLRQAVRETDTIARIGGDEFAVIMESLNEPADVVVGVQHITQAFRKPFSIPGHQFSITLSIGISIYPQDGADAQTLLRNADTAMFRAKEAGRNTYQLYDEEMTRETVERAVMEAALRRAVETDTLEVHYQPQVSLEDGRLVGLEVLTRWSDPELGAVAPERFILLAEEAGLIVQLGEQVLEKACQQFMAWQEQGLDTGVVAVNLSGKQLGDPALLERVSHVLERNNCPPTALEFEITESFVMNRVDESIATMKRLRSMGIELAIDDFGTGYSSLAYLKLLPISKLKIDRSFIDGIPHDENDRVIARAVIALGKTLGLKVIAEGVETAEQDQFLREAGCDEAQGNYYGKQVPAERIGAMLRNLQGDGLG